MRSTGLLSVRLASMDGKRQRSHRTCRPRQPRRWTLRPRFRYHTARRSRRAFWKRRVSKRSGKYFETASGKILSVTVDAPGGVTDFIAITQLIADELNLVGIQASANVVAGPSFGATLNEGRFTLALDYINPSASDYRVFDGLLNANEIGKYGDYPHWNNPQTQKLLNEYAATNSPSVEKAALQGLINIEVKTCQSSPS